MLENYTEIFYIWPIHNTYRIQLFYKQVEKIKKETPEKYRRFNVFDQLANQETIEDVHAFPKLKDRVQIISLETK